MGGGVKFPGRIRQSQGGHPTLDLTVRSHTRDSYAFGALAAAKFLATRKPGLYSMGDVLGL